MTAGGVYGPVIDLCIVNARRNLTQRGKPQMGSQSRGLYQGMTSVVPRNYKRTWALAPALRGRHKKIITLAADSEIHPAHILFRGTWRIIMVAVTLVLLSALPAGAQETEAGASDWLKWDNPSPKHFGSPGILRCSGLRLLSPSGEPIKFNAVTLQKQHWKWARHHTSVVKIYYRPVRKMKTNARGEVQVPELALEGTYNLSFKIRGKIGFGQFGVGPYWKGEACTESLVVEDHQDYLQLSEKVMSNAAEK